MTKDVDEEGLTYEEGLGCGCAIFCIGCCVLLFFGVAIPLCIVFWKWSLR